MLQSNSCLLGQPFNNPVILRGPRTHYETSHSQDTSVHSIIWKSRRIRSHTKTSQSVLSLCDSKLLVFLLSALFFVLGDGFGSMSSIAISTGEDGLICAIEASGKQQPYCWGSDVLETSADELPLYGLSGGRGFICGTKVGSWEPFCWEGNLTSINLVPTMYLHSSYSSIAAGANHVCALRNSIDIFSGTVDCWSMGGMLNEGLHPPSDLPPLKQVISGNDYSCGLSNASGQVFCWGYSAYNVTNPPEEEFESLAAGAEHVCGILKDNRQARCWGYNDMGQAQPPRNISFVALTGSYSYSCGIRADNHELARWGSFNRSAIPNGIEFMAIASGNVTCGVREDNFLVDCWGTGLELSPPLLLFSPGMCNTVPCQTGEFAFNASSLGIPSLVSLCLSSSERICARCAHLCPTGTFLSSLCNANGDRQCTDCSLCQNETCRSICLLSPAPLVGLNISIPNRRTIDLPAVLGAAISCMFVVVLLVIVLFCLTKRKKGKFSICGRRSDTEVLTNGSIQMPTLSSTANAVTRQSNELFRMQAFRLAELKDATNNFKELNELGRGSYGFVYRAVLPDGRQVAVKRANAARRIHSNSRDFEAELDILCKVRHAHLVNLLGYCEEMGERLLVYEYMSHGTLHDHLHGGLSPLSWGLRLKIAIQSARGIEYLHKDAMPRILHRDIKSSNILLDADWGARVADFGLSSADRSLQSPMKQAEAGYLDPNFSKSQNFTEKSDVYSFGVVLLELLSGRKPIDMDYEEPNIVEWAAPLIDNGKAACILDGSIDMPKNLEPLMRMADIAELCVREKPEERPSMADVAAWLDQVGRGSSMM